MMKLTLPKKQPQPKFNLTRRGSVYYVTSEKHPSERYMVIQHGQLFLCQCNDFFGRKLPNLGGPDFELCKHGEFVKQVVNTLPGQVIEATKEHKHATSITGTVGL